jgi:hypothetical protein
LPAAFDGAELGLAPLLVTALGEAGVARALELVEEAADFLGKLFGAAEVDGVLALLLAVDEAEVGAEAGRAACAVGGDDRSDAGEEGSVAADEVEAGVGGHGRVEWRNGGRMEW